MRNEGTTLVIGGTGKTGRRVAGGVARALARAPKDFRDYARDAAQTSVWTP